MNIVRNALTLLGTHLLAAGVGLLLATALDARVQAPAENIAGYTRHLAASRAVDLTFRFGRAEQARAFILAFDASGETEGIRTRVELMRHLRLTHLSRELGDDLGEQKYLAQANALCASARMADCSRDALERGIATLGRQPMP